MKIYFVFWLTTGLTTPSSSWTSVVYSSPWSTTHQMPAHLLSPIAFQFWLCLSQATRWPWFCPRLAGVDDWLMITSFRRAVSPLDRELITIAWWAKANYPKFDWLNLACQLEQYSMIGISTSGPILHTRTCLWQISATWTTLKCDQ